MISPKGAKHYAVETKRGDNWIVHPYLSTTNAENSVNLLTGVRVVALFRKKATLFRIRISDASKKRLTGFLRKKRPFFGSRGVEV